MKYRFNFVFLEDEDPGLNIRTRALLFHLCMFNSLCAPSNWLEKASECLALLNVSGLTVEGIINPSKEFTKLPPNDNQRS